MAQNLKPTYDGFAATASDSVSLATIHDGFMCVTTSGDISVLAASGATIVFKTVALNTPIPVRINRINSTGTTATGLIALKSPYA